MLKKIMDGSLMKYKSNSFSCRTNRKRKYSTYLQCENCDVSSTKTFFYSAFKLENSNNLYRFKCKICDKIYATDVICNTHMILEHPKDYERLQQQQSENQRSDNAIKRLNELIFRESPPNVRRRRRNSCIANFHHLRPIKRQQSTTNNCDNSSDDLTNNVDFNNMNLIDALLCGIDRRLWRTINDTEAEDDSKLLQQSISKMLPKLEKFLDEGPLCYEELNELLSRMLQAYQIDKQAISELPPNKICEFKPKYWFFYHIDSFVQLVEARKKHDMLKISLRIIVKQPYDEKVFSEEEILFIIDAFKETPILWNTNDPMYQGQLDDEETLFELFSKLTENHPAMPLLNPTLLCVQLMQLETYYSAEKFLRERDEGLQSFMPRFPKIWYSLEFLWPHVPPFQCDNCGRIFELEASYRAHNLLELPCPLPDRVPQPYTCRVCGKLYASSENFELHLRRHDADRSYKCSQCSKYFENYAKLLQHRRIHFFSQSLKCDNCGLQFHSLKLLRLHRIVTRHYLRRRPLILKFYCDWCNRRVLNEFYLHYHRDLHANNCECDYEQTGFEDDE